MKDKVSCFKIKKENKMVKATEIAEKQIKAALIGRKKGIGIRLGVRTSGCNGYAYTLEFADKVEKEDQVTQCDGFVILVDEKSQLFLEGVILDYAKKGLNEGFEFINEKEKSRCGCGESFQM